MGKRLGLLGGTFDPIHYGHLMIAETVGDFLDLNTVLFLPAANPPHKPGRPVPSAEHRLRMTELAVADNPRFAVSTIDIETSGRSYTVDLLERVALAHPRAELYFIMGADSLRDFPSWHDPAGISERALLAVARRPGVTFDLNVIIEAVPALKDRIRLVPTPGFDISATQLRARVAAGQSIRYLTPEPVRLYLLEQRLYHRIQE